MLLPQHYSPRADVHKIRWWLRHPNHFILIAGRPHTLSSGSAPATAVWGHKDVTPSWYICLVSLTHNGGSRRTFTWVLTCNMSYVMIETPLTLHTYRRSYLYIYKDFQHLSLWLLVTRMQPHTDICLVSSPSGGRWKKYILLGSHLYHAACYDVVTPFNSYS